MPAKPSGGVLLARRSATFVARAESPASARATMAEPVTGGSAKATSAVHRDSKQRPHDGAPGRIAKQCLQEGRPCFNIGRGRSVSFT